MVVYVHIYDDDKFLDTKRIFEGTDLQLEYIQPGMIISLPSTSTHSQKMLCVRLVQPYEAYPNIWKLWVQKLDTEYNADNNLTPPTSWDKEILAIHKAQRS